MRKKITTAFMASITAFGIHAAGATSTQPEQTVAAKPALTFNAIAYLAGHGGHLSAIDLRVMKSPDDLAKGRVVVIEAGKKPEGVTAGMPPEETGKASINLSQALAVAGDKEILVAATSTGDVYTTALASGERQGPIKAGQQFGGAVTGPDGAVYLADMADGHLSVFDAQQLKTVDRILAGKALRGIQWTANGKKAYITDLAANAVYVYDWTTRTKTREITSPDLTFIHQARITPDSEELWIAIPSGDKPGQPPNRKNQVLIIDTGRDEIVRRIILPESVRPKDFAFSPDNRYAFLSSQTVGNDSVLHVMDRKDYSLITQISACADCHFKNKISMPAMNDQELLCGLVIDWNPGR